MARDAFHDLGPGMHPIHSLFPRPSSKASCHSEIVVTLYRCNFRHAYEINCTSESGTNQVASPLSASDLATDLAEGILDPFPLLLANAKAPVKEMSSKLVNPLLLVTEKKGTAYSLHYAAFPLDAFHTEGLVCATTIENVAKRSSSCRHVACTQSARHSPKRVKHIIRR